MMSSGQAVLLELVCPLLEAQSHTLTQNQIPMPKLFQFVGILTDFFFFLIALQALQASSQFLKTNFHHSEEKPHHCVQHISADTIYSTAECYKSLHPKVMKS